MAKACRQAAVHSRITLALLTVLFVASYSQRLLAQQGASLIGTVRDSAGRPIEGAEVGVAGAGLHEQTDARGAFRIAGLAAGPATVLVRRLGFRSEQRSVDLESLGVVRVDLILVVAPEMLQPMHAEAQREVYDARLAGFNARSQQKVGHFVTRERIERANSTSLTDMLREVPGVKMGSSTMEGRHVRLRGATCAPLVFVDGFPAAAGEFDLDMVDLQSVEGVEIYSGLGSIPPEFSGPRDLSRCGVIALWLAPSRPKHRPVQAVSAAQLAQASEFLAPSDEVRTLDQVDEAARLQSGALQPQYPDSLFAAKVTGKVVVEFVVDTTGKVEPATIDILEASNPLFAGAVRTSLRGAHFTPAVLAGHKVRQYVQLPFTFAVRDTVPPQR